MAKRFLLLLLTGVAILFSGEVSSAQEQFPIMDMAANG
jgi:hypothetical protein